MRIQYPKLQLNLKYFSFKTFKLMSINGLFFSISAIGSILILKYDKILLSKSIGLEFVAKLVISIKLYIIGEKIVSLIFNNIRPYISQFYGSNNIAKTKEINDIMIYSLYFLCSLTFWFIIIINENFVKAWVGDEYFVGNEISILFGMFYYFNSLTLGNRIVLVATLKYIKLSTITLTMLGI